MTLEEALSEAKVKSEAEIEAGLDRGALEKAAAQGLANGVFEESAEEMPQLLEEFYPEAGSVEEGSAAESAEATASLSDKLNGKAAKVVSASIHGRA